MKYYAKMLLNMEICAQTILLTERLHSSKKIAQIQENFLMNSLLKAYSVSQEFFFLTSVEDYFDIYVNISFINCRVQISFHRYISMSY